MLLCMKFDRNLEHCNFDRISMKILQKQIDVKIMLEVTRATDLIFVDRFNKSITLKSFLGHNMNSLSFRILLLNSLFFIKKLVLNCYIFPEWLDYCTRRCILSTSGYISQETSGYSRSFFRQNRNGRRNTKSSHIFGRILWL